jgi:Uma2 family endonuclease
MSSDASPAHAELPDIDDRLVAPETPFEIWDGELVLVPPSDPPHGTRQLQLCALMEAHTGPEFEAADDLLTRTSRADDIAPDVSVYPAAPDPATGGRQIEQLAFEVVSTQSLGRAGKKAAKLVGRGVRRVFAIDVDRARALEWSAELGSWRALDPTGHIDDPALAVPLPIEALIHNAKADDAVARALLARRNPVLVQDRAEGRTEGRAEGRTEGRAEGRTEGRAEGRTEGRAEGRTEGRAEGRTEGRAEGRAEAVILLLTARGVAVDSATRVRILAERDPQRLDRWIVSAASCAQVAELFADR